MYYRTDIDNGIKVVTEHISAVASACVGIWIDNGSRDEAPELTGISHFIEHLLFKGTEHRKMAQIPRAIESVGGYLNAFTSKENTCYYARIPQAHTLTALDVLLDLVFHPLFPPKEIEKEKEVVIEEIKMYDDMPEDAVFDDFEGAVYGNQPLGVPILGTEASIRSFNQAKLFDFLDQNYGTQKIVIAVAGNIQHEAIVDKVQNFTAKINRKGNAPARTVSPSLPQKIVKYRPIQQAHLALGVRTVGIQQNERNALGLLNTLLGAGMSSRLNLNIREKYGFCYNVYSFANFYTDTGDFGVYIGLDDDKVEKAKTLIFKEFERLTQKEITKKQLFEVKQQVIGGFQMELESMYNRMNRLARGTIYFDEVQAIEDTILEVEAVTAAEMLQVAQCYFQPERFAEVLCLPQENGA